jgi:hypothetical protein
MKGWQKLFLSISISVFAGLCIFPVFANLFSQEDLLKVESSINPLRLSRGEEGKVILKISLSKGIAISPQPALTIELNPGEELVFPKNFFTSSDLNIEVLEENGQEYLNLKKPVEIPFTVNPKAKRGIHILEGKVKYFARSKKEGWCLKRSSKFSATYYTRITIVKKGA